MASDVTLILCRWAMSSLTLKGKPSDHAAPVASMSSSALTPTSSNASSGMPNHQSLPNKFMC